ncbi:MAG: oligosaccharide flippase family protein [bacterium]
MKTITLLRGVPANVLALFTSTTIARGLSGVTLMIIARQLGPDGFGQYSATMALLGVTSAVFTLGLDGWLLYEGGRREHQLDMSYASGLCLKVLLGALWLVGLWILAPALNRSAFPPGLILLGSLSLWMEEIARITWSVLKVQLRNDLTLILMCLLYGLFLGTTLWLAGQQIRDPKAYLAGRSVATLVGAILSILLVARQLGLRLRTSVLPETLRSTLPFAASIALAMVYGRADLTIIAHGLGKSAAGVYGPAVTLTNALFLIPAAIYGVMVPVLSRCYREDPVQAKRTTLLLILAMTFTGLLLGSALSILSRPLINLVYGPPFEASVDVLFNLGAVLAFRCPNVAMAAVLVAVGWQTRRVAVQAVSATLNVVLNLLIVQRLGVVGVARVYILSEAILFVGCGVILSLWIRKEQKITLL